MIISFTWETTPDELRRLAIEMETTLQKGIHLWGQDRVVETISIEPSVQLKIGFSNETWIKELKP